MYHVKSQGVDEYMINVHYYYFYSLDCGKKSNLGKACVSTNRERAIFSQNWGKMSLSTDRERAIFSQNWGKVCLSTDRERLFSVRPTVQLILR